MDANQIQNLLDQAIALKRKKELNQAYALFEKLLETCPQDKIHYCLSHMAHIQYLKGNYQKAQKLAHDSLRHNSQNWFALGILGEIAQKQHQFDEALAYFEEALQRHPGDVYLIIRTAKLLQLTQQPEKALNQLKQALLEQPEQSELVQALGDFFKNQGDIQTARQYYQNAIQLDSNNRYAFRQWIASMEAEKTKSEILVEIEKLLKIPSQQKNNFLRNYYGQLLSQLGRLKESTELLEQTVSAAPRSIYQKTRLAANYNRTQKFQETISLLEPDYQNGVVDPYLFQYLAVAYLGLNQKAAARQLLIKGLKSFPDCKPLRKLIMKAQ